LLAFAGDVTDASALAWKAANDLAESGFWLMEKTIPFWHSLTGTFCLEKKKSGVLALLRMKLNWGKAVASAATAWNPESTPPTSGVQGEAKLDWVTLWFLLSNWNVTVSPTLAVMFEGEKVSWLFCPTRTRISAPEDAIADGAADGADADGVALFSAAAWKAANDLAESGFALMEKTIPFWHSLTRMSCLEKKNNGVLALLRVKLNVGNAVALMPTGWKPESTPCASGTQGEAKLD